MKAVIDSIHPASIAADLGLAAGDEITAVNGSDSLEDLFDWQFAVMGSAYIELAVKHTDGSEEIYEIEKDPDEDLGIGFASPLFTPIKTCNNACPFCFIDQQPAGLRGSLYVKDDDYRLSYFSNTYITLTNLTPHDRKRIERLRPGPLYVSVHCTVPEIRERLLVNKKHAGKIMDELRWLKSLEIPFHCQVVLCPGINDGDYLAQTLRDLASLRPEAQSVAVVPVGLTRYRGELPDLVPVDAQTANRVIETVVQFQEKQEETGREFVFLSDEFYLRAGRPFPDYGDYGDFPQLDDGVGTARMLLQDFFELADALPDKLEGPPQNMMILTGRLGAMILSPIVNRLNEIDGLYIDAVPVENRFWGEAVDVAGLVTGQDIIATLNKQDTSGYAVAVIPSVMLKHGSRVFLDEMTVAEVSRQAGLPIRVAEDPYSARELVSVLLPGAMTPA